MSNHDPVRNPKHYYHPSGIQVIAIVKHETFVRGNIIKYVMRAPYKGEEVQDLEKAMEYLQMELAEAKLRDVPAQQARLVELGRILAKMS